MECREREASTPTSWGEGSNNVPRAAWKLHEHCAGLEAAYILEKIEREVVRSRQLCRSQDKCVRRGCHGEANGPMTMQLGPSRPPN